MCFELEAPSPIALSLLASSASMCSCTSRLSAASIRFLSINRLLHVGWKHSNTVCGIVLLTYACCPCRWASKGYSGGGLTNYLQPPIIQLFGYKYLKTISGLFGRFATVVPRQLTFVVFSAVSAGPLASWPICWTSMSFAAMRYLIWPIRDTGDRVVGVESMAWRTQEMAPQTMEMCWAGP